MQAYLFRILAEAGIFARKERPAVRRHPFPGIQAAVTFDGGQTQLLQIQQFVGTVIDFHERHTARLRMGKHLVNDQIEAVRLLQKSKPDRYGNNRLGIAIAKRRGHLHLMQFLRLQRLEQIQTHRTPVRAELNHTVCTGTAVHQIGRWVPNMRRVQFA